MADFQSSIISFSSDDSLKIIQIKQWVDNYAIDVINTIREAECKKWHKWMNDKTIHLYPCVCPVRNEDCIFVETYFELSRVIEIFKMEEKCEIELSIYLQIKHNKFAIFEWIKANEGLLEKIIYFSTTIKINSSPERSKVLTLNPLDFENILKLQEVFIEYYYSDELKNY